MNARRFVIPSTRSLIAFEAAARLGGVMRASQELNTSASSISRHIRNLEAGIGRKLFQPYGRNVILTEFGRDYFVAVQSALNSLHVAGGRLGIRNNSVLIGCSEDISNAIVQPILDEVKKSLGNDVNIRIIIGESDTLPLLMPIGIDITLHYLGACSETGSVKILDEEIAPVCSPHFIAEYGRTLAKHPRYWRDIPRLDPVGHTSGRATWSTWFEAHGCAVPEAPVERFETHEGALKAAKQGKGMALAWNGFVDALLQEGELVLIREEWMKTGTAIYARLTEFGTNKAVARSCAKALGRLIHLLKSEC